MDDFRNKNQQADNGCSDGVHQDGGGGQVFDLLDAVVAFRTYHIREILDGRVEDFAAEDQPDGKRDGHPLQHRQLEQRARHDDEDSREQMYPAVVFLLEEHLQPVERVCKAFQPLRNRKFLLFLHCFLNPLFFKGQKYKFCTFAESKLKITVMKNILFIVGSLRKQSFNRQLAALAEKMLEGQFNIQYLDFEDVPLMNQDLEANTPAPVARVRKEVLAADGIFR